MVRDGGEGGTLYQVRHKPLKNLKTEGSPGTFLGTGFPVSCQPIGGAPNCVLHQRELQIRESWIAPRHGIVECARRTGVAGR